MAEVIETRPFPPFLPSQATVMMMGTFPPAAEKRAMEFHYPNFQNDMWRVFGLVFFGEKDHFRKGEEKAMDPEKIKQFLDEKGIASCPTVYKAIREHGNASDAFLDVVETVNLGDVLKQIPDCKHIGTTGGKATEILLSLLPEKVKLPKTGETIPFVYDGRELTLTRLPSTSRAYPLSLVKKADAYKNFFHQCGLTTK
ncbi:uracil-DNA glycosylase family protein [Veillonella rodentium]|uniref:G:T/U mismatch-specific DNA glycosylase n=1 Tax=Veillonella rodentium TaxID=248315 RepID=A0A239YGC8_9FIRM|nr:DNA glycosylase [Veillonella rodentium]SNV58311.1 G:T/U mismatch-specific DNA glycosylase [Veillonella rodentium]